MKRLSSLILIAMLIAVLSSACERPKENTVITEPTRAPVARPEQRPPTEVDLTISGVRSGAKQRDVIKLLGKPVRIEKGPFDACANALHRYWHYEGLTIDLLSEDEKGTNYAVIAMELTSSNWEIAPGLHIGDPMSKIRETFGEPVGEDATSIWYVTKNNEGWVHFFFKDGKLTKAEMSETLC